MKIQESSKKPAASRTNPRTRALANWQRWEYVRMRGHREFIERARQLEGFYLGAGLQWDAETRQLVESEGRLAEEVNMILPKVNAALGYQIANRVEIAFRPRGQGADEDKARTLSKVAMQIADNNDYRWVESQVFADGLIESRGYFDVRIDFDDNMVGEVKIDALDPRDVVPDPDAKSYDPDTWADVTITRWYTLDEIEWYYGAKARRAVEQSGDPSEDTDFGDDTTDEGRNKFGDELSGQHYDSYMGEEYIAQPRWRIIDRQYWETVSGQVAVYPTGDIRRWDRMTPAQQQSAQADGAIIVRRPVRQVRWLVSTMTSVLHDDVSPYEHFTVVPYFPVFRRGLTRGMVDNAVSPQRMLNKAISSYIHTISTTANSGWMAEENSLANMTEDELEERGSQAGLTLVYRKGASKPEKINPNQIPTGVDKLIERAATNIDNVTGINETMQGKVEGDLSGIATQSLQFAAQQQLAVMLDNMARTRTMVAKRMLKLIQRFYDEPRIFRITETDATGKEVVEELPINAPQPDGSVLNNLTIGEYDVIVTEQPLQVTFQNSQFQQALELKKASVNIPDAFVLRYSNLEAKQEIIEAMQGQQAPVDPTLEAKAALLQAQADKARADTTARRVETMFSATEAAQNIAAIPQVAPLADTILGSAGYEDQDAAPLLPQALGTPQQSAPMSEAAIIAPSGVPEPESGQRSNTSPLFPPRPTAGIEGGQ